MLTDTKCKTLLVFLQSYRYYIPISSVYHSYDTCEVGSVLTEQADDLLGATAR